MLPPYALLSLFFVASTAVEASPADHGASKRTTLGFTTKVQAGGAFAIVEKDRARAQTMGLGAGLGKRDSDTCESPLSAVNTGVNYIAKVGIGSPETTYELIIDTGSSNTWVGANAPYVETSTSQNTGYSVTVPYGSGNFTGTEWIDTVTFTPDLVVQQQSIGVANSSYGIFPSDGILGLGPVGLTNRTVSGVHQVPTVMDNLLSQGTISQEVLGVHFLPFCGFNGTGELTFGGYDSSVITSPVVYTPQTKRGLPSFYWGIDLSLDYGSDTILSYGGGIVDTGTTLIGLSSSVFKAYQIKTGAVIDNATQLLKISLDQYNQLEPLMFHIGRMSLELTPNAQVFPRSLIGDVDSIYLAVFDLGDVASRVGLDVMVGYTFLERYYSVYDTTSERIGFAPTSSTYLECSL